MKYLVLAVTLILMLPVEKANSTPCFVVTEDFPRAYENARAIFVGKVLRIEKPLSSAADAPMASKLHKVTFKVNYSWKGAGFREFGFPELVVLSDQGRDNCFSSGVFLEGEEYLVYATETADKNLVVALGNRTSLLSHASDDLKELRKFEAFFPIRIRRSVR